MMGNYSPAGASAMLDQIHHRDSLATAAIADMDRARKSPFAGSKGPATP